MKLFKDRTGSCVLYGVGWSLISLSLINFGWDAMLGFLGLGICLLSLISAIYEIAIYEISQH